MSKRLRFVPQTAAADCGSACLAMTLGLYGRQAALDDAPVADPGVVVVLVVEQVK